MTQPSPINISAEDDSSTFQNKKEGEGSDGGGQLEFQQDWQAIHLERSKMK